MSGFTSGPERAFLAVISLVTSSAVTLQLRQRETGVSASPSLLLTRFLTPDSFYTLSSQIALNKDAAAELTPHPEVNVTALTT